MHFALICPPFRSHIHVFETLAAELMRRGHRATFVLNEGAQQYVRQPIDVVTVAGTEKTGMDRVVARAARPNGLFGILRTVADTAMLTDCLCGHAPALLKSLQVDAILGDQMEPAAGLIARHLGLPLLSVACALPIDRHETIPPPFLSWPYDPSEEGLKRNRGGERVARLLLARQRKTIAAWSNRFQLSEACRDMQDCLSPLGSIAQTTEEFDFPRKNDERPLYPVGPIRAAADDEKLPFEIDPNRPFVFMSLGTLQGHRYRLFRIADIACGRIGAQLLVAHCGGLGKRQAAKLTATWVTDFAPQRAVLARADICITHAGQNTVMDALEYGRPVLALPIAFDQPGVAARVAHHRVGLTLSRHLLTVSRMEKALTELLADAGYRERAARLGQSVRAAGGLQKAADIIEKSLKKK